MDSTLVIFILIFNILDCDGVNLKDQLQKYLEYNRKIELIGRKNLEGLENPFKYKVRKSLLDLEDDDNRNYRRNPENVDGPNKYKSFRRLYDFHPGLGATIIGTPTMPGHLPEAEAILPGHTLIRPALGMLKSAVKFPHKDLDNGAGVYGNIDSLGITYAGTGERVLYTGFRRTNRDDYEEEDEEEDEPEEESSEPRFLVKILRTASKKRRRPVERAIIDYYKLEQERKRQREETIRKMREYEKQQPTPFPSIKKGRFKYKKSFENYFNEEDDGENYEKQNQKVLDDDEDIIYNYLFATPKPESKPLYYDKDYDKENDDDGKSYNYVYDRPAEFLKAPPKPENNHMSYKTDDDKENVKKYQKKKKNEVNYQKNNDKENEQNYQKNNDKENEQSYQKNNDKENEQSYQKNNVKEPPKYYQKHHEEDDEYNYLYITQKPVSELYYEKENNKHSQKDYDDENKTYNFVYARPTAAIPKPVSNYKKDNYNGKGKDNDDENKTFVFARPTDTAPNSASEPPPMQFKTVLLNGLQIEFVDTSKLSAIGRSGGFPNPIKYKKVRVHPHERRPRYTKIRFHPHIRSRGEQHLYAGVTRDFRNRQSLKRFIRYIYPTKKTNLRANIIIIN